DGQNDPFGSFELPPGGAADVTFPNPGAVNISMLVGRATVTIMGQTVTLAEGEEHTFATELVPPTTRASVSPPPNAHGWNNDAVTVTMSAIDNAGGSGVKEIHYSLAGAETTSAIVAGDTATVKVTDEGATTVAYFAVDNAGNTESDHSLVVRIDRTPPRITCSATPALLWPPDHL